MTDTASGTEVRGSTHIRYDVDAGRAGFGRAAFRLTHDLADHPLFTIDALVELAERLPQQFIEHNAGNADVVVPDDSAIAPAAASAADVLRTIETRPGFVALPTTVPGLPRQPHYQEVFEEVLADLAGVIDGGVPAMDDHHAVIFVASGGNTTPSHVDPEPSFLLHVRGTKRFSIGRYPDAATEHADLESFYGHAGRNTPVAPVDVEHFDLAPGDAVHVPPVKPHWVENGPDVTISFSVGFQTPADHRRAGVYWFNARARRLGISPSPFGQRPARDRVKGHVTYSAFRARRLLRRA